ncbi:hypothetical protein [Paenibacillus sp. SI8]|uniref:hypothetical protein n=1 Tax=unclassified Paenibacillus TaxID=185978 RepID=UPI0034655CF2
MPTIQLDPNLHRTVHMLKNVEVHKCENTAIAVAEPSLSKEESSALISTFNRPAKNRGKDLLEPRAHW